MNFIKNLRIAYWATFRPDVFDEFVRLYVARKEYNKKAKSHQSCKKEKTAYNIATVRFMSVLKG